MGTYWYNFIEEYRGYLSLPLITILEAFWNYSTGRTLECQSILDSAKDASQQDDSDE